MINVDELKGCWVSKRYTQEKIAEYLGISPKTLHLRLKKGVLGSDDIEKLIKLLDIKDPMRVFFAQDVTHHVTDTRDTA